jgi:hypothetical protein
VEKNTMTIEQSFEVLEDFFVANQVADPLKGMELMVRHFKQLSKLEQEALVVFMAASREKTV